MVIWPIWPWLCIIFGYFALATLKVWSGRVLVTVKINNPYILRKIAFIRVIGLSRDSSAIRYAALVLAIVLVGSVLVMGLTAAKTPVSGATIKVKNTQILSKAPVPATKATALKTPVPAAKAPVLKDTMKTKPTVKPTAKPTPVKTKP
jgi:hypothetical protein